MQLLVFQLVPVAPPPVKEELVEREGEAPGHPEELQDPVQAPTPAAVSNSYI